MKIEKIINALNLTTKSSPESYNNYQISALAYDTRQLNKTQALTLIDSAAGSSRPCQEQILLSLTASQLTSDMIDHIRAHPPRMIIAQAPVIAYLEHYLDYHQTVLCPTSDLEQVRNCNTQLASMLFPSLPQYVAMVTGTNGKSSVVDFARQIWDASHQPAASIGTLGINYKLPTDGSPQPIANNLTTPHPFEMVAAMNWLYDELSINQVAVEASSIGIIQKRLDFLISDNHDGEDNNLIAAFTTFSQDHLDVHGNMDNYFQAKLRLFQEVLGPNGSAVINAD